MSLSVPRGRKPRKARATSALALRNPAPALQREAFPLHAFALGVRSRVVVRGPGAWEFSRYLAGRGDR